MCIMFIIYRINLRSLQLQMIYGRRNQFLTLNFGICLMVREREGGRERGREEGGRREGGREREREREREGGRKGGSCTVFFISLIESET